MYVSYKIASLLFDMKLVGDDYAGHCTYFVLLKASTLSFAVRGRLSKLLHVCGPPFAQVVAKWGESVESRLGYCTWVVYTPQSVSLREKALILVKTLFPNV